jgi:hypothetical protein
VSDAFDDFGFIQDTNPMDLGLVRPTRSHTRAVAAFLASSTFTAHPGKLEGDDENDVSPDEAIETPQAHQTTEVARKKTGARFGRRVVGRAPSRAVAESGVQTRRAKSRAEGLGSEPGEESTSRTLQQTSESGDAGGDDPSEEDSETEDHSLGA